MGVDGSSKEQMAYERSFEARFVPSKSDVFIAVMGMTGAGKSTFISHCTDEEVAISEPGALASCTQEVRVHKSNYFSPHANVYLVDTPGFDDTNRKDTDILKEIAGWMTQTYQQKIRLRGILYLHRISDNRMGGCAQKNLVMFKKLCGADGIKSVVFLTTFWEKVDEAVGESREQTLKETPQFWQFFVDRGAGVQRHLNSTESALTAVAQFVPGWAETPPEEINLAIQTEMVDSGKDLDQTSAGRQLQDDFQKEREKLRQEILEREQDMKEAIEARDKEMIEILRQEQERQSEELKRRDMEMQELKISMERMHEEKIKKLEARLLQQHNENREYRRAMGEMKKKQEEMQRKHAEELEKLRNERSVERDQFESTMKGLSEQIDVLKVEQKKTKNRPPSTTREHENEVGEPALASMKPVRTPKRAEASFGTELSSKVSRTPKRKGPSRRREAKRVSDKDSVTAQRDTPLSGTDDEEGRYASSGDKPLDRRPPSPPEASDDDPYGKTSVIQHDAFGSAWKPRYSVGTGSVTRLQVPDPVFMNCGKCGRVFDSDALVRHIYTCDGNDSERDSDEKESTTRTSRGFLQFLGGSRLKK